MENVEQREAPIAVPVWAFLLAVVALFGIYAFALSNGAALAHGGNVLHEFFHDARHFIGVPCH
jgi:uncharacterized RDD family membrane protein YckC